MEIIAQYGHIFFALAVIFGFYMTWGIGANDVANAMGTSVGSGAITVKQAIIIAAIFEFAGAVFAGAGVTSTIRSGIIDPFALKDTPELLVYGMLAALLASAIWLMIASMRGWPVSTTHTIVGALMGFGVAGVGMEAVKWGALTNIVLSWIVSPIIGGVLALLLMLSIRKLILDTDSPFQNAKRWAPAYVFLVGFIVSLVTVFKGLQHLGLHLTGFESFMVALVVGGLTAYIGHLLVRKITVDDAADRSFHYASVEKVFTPMMIFTAAAMAFAHGSNDVANGIGPMAAVVAIVEEGGKIGKSAHIPLWILLMGGVGIVIGLATMGVRVMQTIGVKITELTPSRGYCATLAAAITVVLASKFGLPVSTTQIAVGSVMGVGFARGIGAVDLRVIGSIVVSWVVTIPAGMILAALLYFMMKGIFS
ncbi:MAG: inorganic phosphate transporter [Gammaproteobacteria bacterium]|nr:inorganic phosphate transporter [Gammaproteobacteria bacterium]